MTLTEIVACPNCPGTGVTTTNRLASEPLKTIPLLGTKAVFDEAPVTANYPVEVCEFPTVKEMFPVVVLEFISRLTISKIVGGVFVAPAMEKFVLDTSK